MHPGRAVLAGALAALAVAPALAADDFLSAEALREAGLVKFWQLQLPLDKGQKILDAYKVDDQLFLCTNDGYVFAVHADTGAIRWLRQVSRFGFRIRRPCHAGDRVIFVTPTHVKQYDWQFGDGVSEMNLWFPAGTSAVSDGTNFYLGSVNWRFYAMGIAYEGEVWKATTSGPLESTPALWKGTLFVASDDYGVYACRAANKRFVWQASTTGANTADVVVDDNGVFVASRDQSLYLFDFQFGQVRWRARFSGALTEPPVLTPDAAYQYCPDDGLVAVNAGVVDIENRIRWKLYNGRSLLTVDDKSAYVLGRNGSILVADLKSGKVRHVVAAPGFTLALPAPDEKSVFVASADGRVFVARPPGAPLVRRDQIREALMPPKTADETGEVAAATTSTPTPGGADTGDLLTSSSLGPLIGGKSRISRGLEPLKPGADKPSDTPPSDAPADEPTEKPADAGADAPTGDTPAEPSEPEEP